MSENTASNNATDKSATASVPQITPQPDVGYGHPEYHFVQSIMEMQKTLGQINSSIKNLEQSVESTKSKVDDLVRWKNMILGGAIVAGILISVSVYLISKISDYIEIKVPPAQIVEVPQAQQSIKPPSVKSKTP